MAKKGDSQKDVADMLAVSASAVNRKIRGFSDWTVTEIFMLCDHYQQKFEFLFRNNKR